MKGSLIAVEGIDGSGKETQTKLLYKYIKEIYDKNSNKRLVKYISFPDYDSPSSDFVKMYLKGEFGNNPLQVNPYAVSSFFAIDRFMSFTKKWKSDYDDSALIVANRYTTSNASYQMAKISENEWDNYLKWIYDYEYNKLGLPKADLTIYLDISVELSQTLMNKRYLGDKSKRDMHESNINFLNLCVQASKYAAKVDNWTVISCENGGKLKSIEEINAEIIRIVNKQNLL